MPTTVLVIAPQVMHEHEIERERSHKDFRASSCSGLACYMRKSNEQDRKYFVQAYMNFMIGEGLSHEEIPISDHRHGTRADDFQRDSSKEVCGFVPLLVFANA